MEELRCVQEVNQVGWSERQAPSYESFKREVAETVMENREIPKGRRFKQAGEQVHPNLVGYVLPPEQRAVFDMPLY